MSYYSGAIQAYWVHQNRLISQLGELLASPHAPLDVGSFVGMVALEIHDCTPLVHLKRLYSNLHTVVAAAKLTPKTAYKTLLKRVAEDVVKQSGVTPLDKRIYLNKTDVVDKLFRKAWPSPCDRGFSMEFAKHQVFTTFRERVMAVDRICHERRGTLKRLLLMCDAQKGYFDSSNKALNKTLYLMTTTCPKELWGVVYSYL